MRSTGRAELVGGTVCTQAVGLEKKTLLSECCRVLAVDIGRLGAAFLAVDLLQHLVEQ